MLPQELQTALNQLDTADAAYQQSAAELAAAQAVIAQAQPAKAARTQALAQVQRMIAQHFPTK